MNVQKEIKHLPNSAVELKVTVAKADTKKEYDGLIQKYAKDAHIPGFRKGKVPASVLELKFGEGIRIEAAQHIMDKSLQELIPTIDEKPLSFAPPKVKDEELKLTFDSDFTFVLEYDIFPRFEISNYQGVEIEDLQVSITKKDEDKELEILQEQNSMVMEKSGKVVKDDIVTINSVELDAENKEMESTRRQGFVFTVGTGHNFYKYDDEVIGMSKDVEKTISKTYPADFEIKELADTTKKLKLLITQVKEKKLPEINDELAQDISDEYKTISDLRSSIKTRLEKNAETKIKEKKLEAILSVLAEATPFEIPVSMIDAELEQSWRTFASQSRINVQQMDQILGTEGKAKMLEGWKPQAITTLRHRLILEKIIDAEKFTVSPEDLQAEIERQAEAGGLSKEESRAYFDKNGLTTYVEHDLKDKMAANFLLEKAKTKKSKKLAYVDLFPGNE